MKKMLLLISSLLVVACMDNEVASRKEECLRKPCTDSQCVVWDDVLNRCGTPDALKMEHLRLENNRHKKSENDGEKTIPASTMLNRIHIRINERKIDSIKILDSESNKSISALEMLNAEYSAALSDLEQKHNVEIQRLKEYELKTDKPITAVQWLTFENKRFQAELDRENTSKKE